MRNVSDRSCGENKITILCSVTLFRKSCVNDKVFEKYCREGQATDNDMAHAQCMLDTNTECVRITAFSQ